MDLWSLLTQRFPRCVISTCSHLPHREANSLQLTPWGYHITRLSALVSFLFCGSSILSWSNNCYFAIILTWFTSFITQWANHATSLKLEAYEMAEIKRTIEINVSSKLGTWIDWQYLIDATELLKKCRYTLQYTYPYAYYLEKGARKELVSWIDCLSCWVHSWIIS